MSTSAAESGARNGSRERALAIELPISLPSFWMDRRRADQVPWESYHAGALILIYAECGRPCAESTPEETPPCYSRALKVYILLSVEERTCRRQRAGITKEHRSPYVGLAKSALD